MKKFNALSSSVVRGALGALSLFAIPALTLAEGAAPQSVVAAETASMPSAASTATAPVAAAPPATSTASTTPAAAPVATPPAPTESAAKDTSSAAAPDSAAAPAASSPAAPTETAIAAPADGASASSAALPPPPEGKGQVVFFRPSRFTGSALSFSVHKEKLGIGKLGNGTYFVYVAEPGLNEFTIQSEVTDKLRLEIDAGDTYYVEQKIAMGIMMGRPVLAPSTKEEFEKKPLKVSVKKATDLK